MKSFSLCKKQLFSTNFLFCIGLSLPFHISFHFWSHKFHHKKFNPYCETFLFYVMIKGYNVPKGVFLHERINAVF